MNVLVTGGAGYIGSHAALRLLDDGHEVTVVDDMSRGNQGALEVLSGQGPVHIVEADAGDVEVLAPLMTERRIELVMHFAALTYVGESVEQPLRYYRKNTGSSLGLLEAMDRARVERLVFSSTCATYGEPAAEHIPISEDCPQHPINPYGRSKLMVERMLLDYAAMKAARGEDFACAALRYFNVAGCDRRGRLGEDHRPETHLIPICLEVALGQRDHLIVFGTDYDTPDGTCIRDYVHVEDLIDAHVAAMEALQPGNRLAYNVGIGRGYSVREVVEATQQVTGEAFAIVEGPRRPGDPPALYNDPGRVNRQLGWQAGITDLAEIIDSAWQWKKRYPGGYEVGG